MRARNKIVKPVADNNNVAPVISRVTKVVSDLNLLYDKRKDAIVSPELLEQASYAPPVDVAPVDVAPLSTEVDGGSSAGDIANDPNAVG